MSQEKIKCAIIGSGNIGTDIMDKLMRSETLEVTALIGIVPESKGLQEARENGVKAIDTVIDGLIEDADLADIVFEATSAKAHAHNAPILKEMGTKTID